MAKPKFGAFDLGAMRFAILFGVFCTLASISPDAASGGLFPRSMVKDLSKALKALPGKETVHVIKGNNASPVAAVLEREILEAEVELGKVYIVTPTPDLEAATRLALLAMAPAGSSLEGATAIPNILRVRDVEGKVVDLKAYVLAGRPLRYVASTNTYVASLMMGVFPVAEESASRKLSAPIVFQILGGVAKQALAVVDHTSPPFLEIELEYSSYPQPRSVLISSPAKRDGMAIPLSVQPSLQLIVERPEIQGYGLETSKIFVALTGIDKLAGHQVSFSTSPGYIEMSSKLTDENGHLTATLRSESAGVSRVTATIPGVAQGSQEVNFKFPYLTLAASLIGGLVGGLIRLLTAQSQLPLISLLKGLFVAALIGALVFALYAVGVNTLPISPIVTVGTIVVIVVSAVGAFLGNLRIARPDVPVAPPWNVTSRGSPHSPAPSRLI